MKSLLLSQVCWFILGNIWLAGFSMVYICYLDNKTWGPFEQFVET